MGNKKRNTRKNKRNKRKNKERERQEKKQKRKQIRSGVKAIRKRYVLPGVGKTLRGGARLVLGATGATIGIAAGVAQGDFGNNTTRL